MRPAQSDAAGIYIGVPDQPARRYILENTLSTVPLEPDVSIDDIAERTSRLTGADLQGLMDRIVDPAFEKAMESNEPVAVSQADVDRAIGSTGPSISEKDLRRYEKFRDTRE